MASGELPFDTYHRAQALGEGTYGSVLTVYNNSGDEFACKVFDADEDHETMVLGTLREISILRILRGSNGHPNVVEIADVQAADEEGGGVGDGHLCMAMPLYPMGDLKRAIQRGIVPRGPAGRRRRVEVAHGLLSAVAFLHDNHIMHRDIKSDNVMLASADDGEGVRPVLIDFSLAKTVGGPFTVLPPGATHTGEVGTPTYTAPEVVAREPYGLKSDLWSVGVVLLEALVGELEVDRDKAAARAIEEKKSSLPDSPYVNLLRGLLETDAERRLSAREALRSPLFEKFGIEVPPARVVDFSEALPVGDADEEDENIPVGNATNKKKSALPKKNAKLTPRERMIKKLCNEIGAKNNNTELAAAMYAKEMEQMDDELDDIAASQTLLHCAVVASRFYEEELQSLEELEEDDGECFPSFKDFSIEEFRDNEVTIFMLMDYCLYIR